MHDMCINGFVARVPLLLSILGSWRMVLRRCGVVGASWCHSAKTLRWVGNATLST